MNKFIHSVLYENGVVKEEVGAPAPALVKRAGLAECQECGQRAHAKTQRRKGGKA